MSTITPPPKFRVPEQGNHESASIQRLREWFEAQEKGNIERLESAAQTLIQLITGLYGVLFAVLALNSNPPYLQAGEAKVLGGITILLFFIGLAAALVVLYPRSYVYQEDNVTLMERTFKKIIERKKDGLMVAVVGFGGGMLFLFLLLLFVFIVFPMSQTSSS